VCGQPKGFVKHQIFFAESLGIIRNQTVSVRTRKHNIFSTAKRVDSLSSEIHSDGVFFFLKLIHPDKNSKRLKFSGCVKDEAKGLFNE